MNDRALRAVRTRWAAIGAAIAVSIGGGGMAITHAAVSSGERDVFVPIAPCRVFDTRSGASNVGLRSTPIGAGETYTEQITGANGMCTTPIPAGATGVAMNVTVVDGTAAAFLTIWPSDVTPRPTVSSLNWTAGAPPTPNKVDTKLSPTGQINLFNSAGTVNVLADIVGYYTDHNHDDRYFTKTEVAAAPYSHILAAGFVLSSGTLVASRSFGNVTAARTATGVFTITLPAYDPGCTFTLGVFATATLVDTAGSISSSNSTGCVAGGDTSLTIRTFNTAGSLTDIGFIFTIMKDG